MASSLPAKEFPGSYTGMTDRFGFFAGAFARRFFKDFAFEESDLAQLRQLETRGAVVYVMRYSSRLDYFLFNWLFLKEGIRLAGFANGIRYYLYRPLWAGLRLMVSRLVLRLRLRNNDALREQNLATMRQLLTGGGSVFLFLRTNQVRSRVLRNKGAIEAAQKELDYLRAVIDTAFDEPVPVSLVPIALFWRKGARTRRRFLNVFYGAPERPTDTSKVLSFLWNYENLALRVGTPIDLRGFVDDRRTRGDDAPSVLKKVRRSLLIFLRREEKPVMGAALRPLARIEEAVLLDPSVRAEIQAAAQASGRSELREETRALRCLREIAANPSPTMLAILDVIVSWMFRRLFARIEVTGLDRIVEEAKLRPLVLAPCHRSHFDYVILSWLFYERHLVPPLVAAGLNLSFWPLGGIFRRAGAFFLRRSFGDDQLYRAVFRSYVSLLLRDGVTQEFFIEGGRSRTGKTVEPRLGMLGMIQEAFQSGARRDVAVVPIGFTYERLVEEGAMAEERRGSQKKRENLLELFRARSVFGHRFGSVAVRFGEPLSLAEWAHKDTRVVGEEISRRINELIPVGRSAASAAALLGTPAHGAREEEFVRRVEETVSALECVGFPLSEGMASCRTQGRLGDAVELLTQAGLVDRLSRPSGDLLSYAQSARETLAYYRATLAPGLVWPAVLALSLTREMARADLMRSASRWLDLLRLEYFPPTGAERDALHGAVIDHFCKRDWLIQDADTRLDVTAEGEPWLAFFAAQVRPVLETYRALFSAAARLDEPATRKALLADAENALGDQLLLGEALCSEAVCPTTFGNALRWLVDERVLTAEGSVREGDTLLARGPEFEALVELGERLARTLRSR